MSHPARTTQVGALLTALADPVRRQAVEILGEGPRRAEELAGLPQIDPPAVSRYRRILRQSGLVAETHPDFDQRARTYALHAVRLGDLKDWLARAEAGWSRQLSAFRAHVVATTGTSQTRARQGRKP